MARQIFKKVLLTSLGAVSLAGFLSGGLSHASSNCSECDLLRVEALRPDHAALGNVGARNLREGINIAAVFNRPRDFEFRGESPMAPILDPHRNPYLNAVTPPADQSFLFVPWGAFSARPQDAADPAVLFPVRVQPMWNVSQGYFHLNTTPWSMLSFGNPNEAAQAVAHQTLGALAL